ncbi:MAG: hypothetical protein EOO75_13620 [Myxococcales bacterium]|nr:MAG: hypothetical protein EOO75_13620 [Myxococcales bacterium]
MNAPRVLHLEPGQAIVEIGPALVVVLQRIQTVATSRALLAATRERGRRPPAPVVYVIEPFLGLPAADARHVLLDVSREADRTYSALGMIVLGGPLQVAAARAFVIGLRLATGTRMPFEVFASLAAAPPWIRRLDPAFPATETFVTGVQAIQKRVSGQK